MSLLQVDDVSIRFGGVVALNGLTFTIEPGQICGLIGPNGAGKTTMFNVISRVYDPTSGSVTFDGIDLLAKAPHQIASVGIARTFQNLALFPSMTLLQNTMVGAHSVGRVGFVKAVFRVGAKKEEREMAERAFFLLSVLGLEKLAFHPAAGLPFGTLERLELARAMASQPKLLLLDEPASGLTHAEVDELGETIKMLRDRFGLTVLLVEHHMQMVMGISDKVVAMDAGQKISEGTPEHVGHDPRVIEAYLGTAA